MIDNLLVHWIVMIGWTGRFYRGTSLTRNYPPPQGHHRALGIVLLLGPRRRVFLMSEVPL